MAGAGAGRHRRPQRRRAVGGRRGAGPGGRKGGGARGRLLHLRPARRAGLRPRTSARNTRGAGAGGGRGRPAARAHRRGRRTADPLRRRLYRIHAIRRDAPAPPRGPARVEPMRFGLITIFPDFFTSPLAHGVVARARAAGRLEVAIHNLRDYAPGPHHITDDRPFGGGEGMVMKPEPIYAALEALLGRKPGPAGPESRTRVILLSAQGRALAQADARRLAEMERLVLICGRYEGVDERIAAHCVDEEVSIGDFVLSG